jgi:hypothetical protein
MLAPGTKVRVRKPPDGKNPSISSGGNLYWTQFMDPLDGTVQEVASYVSDYIVLRGAPFLFALEWLEELPTPGLTCVEVDLAVAPKNNDGRSTCFWCCVSTAKRGGGAYDVCPKCGR